MTLSSIPWTIGGVMAAAGAAAVLLLAALGALEWKRGRRARRTAPQRGQVWLQGDERLEIRQRREEGDQADYWGEAPVGSVLVVTQGPDEEHPWSASWIDSEEEWARRKREHGLILLDDGACHESTRSSSQRNAALRSRGRAKGASEHQGKPGTRTERP